MILSHAHMWVPWDARRLHVCDEPGCHAAIKWDDTEPRIFDLRSTLSTRKAKR